MRLLSFEYDGRESFGAVVDNCVVELSSADTPCGPDLRAFLADPPPRWQDRLSSGRRLSLGAIRFRPVIPNPSKIVCVGLNYADHLSETGCARSLHPVLFLRVPSSQIGHLQPLIRPRVSEQLDYEGELAVIIGRGGRYIRSARALEHVAGYSLYNDGSVRDWQKHSHQYTAGKNFPGTGAFGPWLVTADEIPDPRALTLTTRLNEQLVQQGCIADMIFPIEELIPYVSSITGLEPGDVLLTGTPSGVGALRQPPIWMKPGDTVEVAIPQIGVLRNPIADEPRENTR